MNVKNDYGENELGMNMIKPLRETSIMHTTPIIEDNSFGKSNKIRIIKILAATVVLLSLIASGATLFGLLLRDKVDSHSVVHTYFLKSDIDVREDILFKVENNREKNLQYVTIPANKAHGRMEYLRDFKEFLTAYRDSSTHWCLIKRLKTALSESEQLLSANKTVPSEISSHFVMKISPDVIPEDILPSKTSNNIAIFCKDWPAHWLLDKTDTKHLHRKKRQSSFIVERPPPIIIVQKPSSSLIPQTLPSSPTSTNSLPVFSLPPFPIPPSPLPFDKFVQLINPGNSNIIPPPNSVTTIPSSSSSTVNPQSYCEFNCTSANSNQPDPTTGQQTQSSFDLCDTKCLNYFSSQRK